MAVKALRELLIEELRDTYSAEKMLAKALPKLAKAAFADSLKRAFQSHAKQNKSHIERLEQIFEKLDTRTRGKHCEPMEGLIEEALEILQMDLIAEKLDIFLISVAQKMQHYQIANYGTLHALSAALGSNQEVTDILESILNEERDADEELSEIFLNYHQTFPAPEHMAVALAAVLEIFQLWELQSNEVAMILGAKDNQQLAEWSSDIKSNGKVSLPANAVMRISHILSIFKSLQIIFHDSSRADEWIKRPNRNFGGESALGYILKGNMNALTEVRHYIDSIVEGEHNDYQKWKDQLELMKQSEITEKNNQRGNAGFAS